MRTLARILVFVPVAGLTLAGAYVHVDTGATLSETVQVINAEGGLE